MRWSKEPYRAVWANCADVENTIINGVLGGSIAILPNHKRGCRQIARDIAEVVQANALHIEEAEHIRWGPVMRWIGMRPMASLSEEPYMLEMVGVEFFVRREPFEANQSRMARPLARWQESALEAYEMSGRNVKAMLRDSAGWIWAWRELGGRRKDNRVVISVHGGWFTGRVERSAKTETPVHASHQVNIERFVSSENVQGEERDWLLSTSNAIASVLKEEGVASYAARLLGKRNHDAEQRQIGTMWINLKQSEALAMKKSQGNNTTDPTSHQATSHGVRHLQKTLDEGEVKIRESIAVGSP